MDRGSDRDSETIPEAVPLLDRAHLDAQTFGDAALADEILGLFAGQCRHLVPGIGDDALPAPARADLAHTLKGSALGVGAMRVAALAARAEDALRAGAAGPPTRDLTQAVAATLALFDGEA